jgi:hypothetical protein
MAVAAYFHPESLSSKQYDEVISRLEAAGAGSPKGRTHHSSFGDDGHMMVYEVWESQEDMDAFGATLMPILAEVGINPGQAQIMPLHNLIQ